MSRFTAKINNYGKHKNNLSENLVKNYTWDFTKMTIRKLGEELENSINLGTPIFLWSKKRLNNKIELDNKKQVFIFEKIRNLRAITEEFGKLQADAIFSQELIENLVEEKRMVVEQFFKRAIANHKYLLTKIKVDIDLTNSLTEHDQIEKERKIKINEGIDADNRFKNAQAANLEAQTELNRMVMSKIDFSNFPPAYISELLAALSGVNVRSFSEFNMEEKLNNIYERMGKTQARKAEAEVDDFVNSAEYRKWKNDQAQRDAKTGGL